MLKKISEFLNNKVANAVYALVASVLVHLIGSRLEASDFEVIQFENRTIVKQVPTGSLLTDIVAVLMPFLLFWLFLNLVLPFLLQFLERVAYKTMPKYSIYEVCDRYRKIRADILEAVSVLNKRKNDDKISYCFDCFEKIISGLNELFALFLHAKTQGILSSCFSDQYSETGKLLSKYEFICLVDLIDAQLILTEKSINETVLKERDAEKAVVMNDIKLARNNIEKMKTWPLLEEHG